MKLIYRGIEYEYAPETVEVTTEGVCGKYRGAEWKCHYSKHIPITHHAAELKYRGASYYSGNPQEVEELKQRKKLDFIFAKDNQTFFSNQPNNELARIHLANLQRSVQRRLEVAKQNGDENLVRKLEEEANQLSS
ncbi:DUF4278 domain-containing protein [Calothrix sp. CCY 0018]|uniref:arginine synthesis PII-interacting regulator PirA n=1 Tax=Calothrix sp. CCY 0018 TaxID=3103864 RepID=UPI0039C5E686